MGLSIYEALRTMTPRHYISICFLLYNLVLFSTLNILLQHRRLPFENLTEHISHQTRGSIQMPDRSPSRGASRRRSTAAEIPPADYAIAVADTPTLEIPSTTVDPTALESTLNTRSDQAFASLIHILHLPPNIAAPAAQAYRVALSSSTLVSRFADTNGWDTGWLYFAGAIFAYLGLSVTEKLIAMGKWVLLVPIVGVPLWKLMRRRGLKEIREMLMKGTREEGEGREEAPES
ncbi:MAG: hypothetical protein Q9182_007578 [Xanthomendoza sp. 2 TL-2023]